VGTNNLGILRIAPNGTDVDTLSIDVRGEGTSPGVRSLVARRDGSVWVAVTGASDPRWHEILVFGKDGGQPVRLSSQHGVPTENVNVMHETSDRVLYGGTNDGVLWRADARGKAWTLVPVNRDLPFDIASILSVSNEELWVTSEGGGVMRLDPGATRFRQIYTRRNGLVSDAVHRVMRDVEGNLWFAQSGGASRLRSNYAAFVNYTSSARAGEPLLPSPSINAVIPPVQQLGLDAMWLGTSESGLVCLTSDNQTQAITTAHGLRHDWVNSRAFDAQGRLWVGTVSGINCISADRSMLGPGAPRRAPATSTLNVFGRTLYLTNYVQRSTYTVQRVPIPSGPSGPLVESMWFSCFRNLICLVNNTWYVMRDASGLPAGTAIQVIDIGKDGRMWVGTRGGGIYRSKQPITVAMLSTIATTPLPFPPNEGVGNFGVEVTAPVFEPVWSEANQIDALIWNQGVLWVGTPDGVFALEGDPIRVSAHLTRENGMRANNGTSMAFAPDGELWVGTNGGLTEIDPAARTVRRTITRADGLVDNEVWFLSSVRCGADGTVYFGTAKGLASYRPAFDIANALAPRVVFSKTGYWENSNGSNELSLEYAALSFADEKRVRYRTRLVGYDKDWSAETADFKTRYTNLGAFLVSKTYTFEVMACNNAGVWTSEPLRHEVAVNPAWWLRWYSMLGQLVLLGGIVLGINNYRMRALEARNRALEHTVQERTAEVRAQAETLREQNIELDEKNQEIMRTQQQLIVQEKLASLGQLTAGIAHEIRNPLNFVNNFAQLSGGLIDELREDINANKEKLGDKSADYIESIIQDLEGNMKRINEHGKRADGIVQGMLMHSRGQKGERTSVKLNALIDEQAQLTYLSVRNSKPDLSVVFKKEYDDTIGEIMMIPQDLSRVFINLINNACYAAEKRKASMPPDWMPLITMITKNLGDKVEVRIKDNGTGMPEAVREKVFLPFFTTKPTGEGTGLGLSISYDIIVQEHKGTIRVESKENEGTEFIIELPKK
jgi:signal transduction histidine kinase/ligand-binding sensor domain-containing protein